MDADLTPPDPAPRQSNRARKKRVRNDEVTTITTKKAKSAVAGTENGRTHQSNFEGDGNRATNPTPAREAVNKTAGLVTSKGKKGKKARPVVLTDTESGSERSSGSDSDGIEIVEPVDQEEAAEAELGKWQFQDWEKKKTNFTHEVRLKKTWNSPIYGFFQAEPTIEIVGVRRCHNFICLADPCKGQGSNGKTVRYDGNAVFTLVKRFSNGIQSLAKHETRCIYLYYNDNALAKSPAVW